MPLGMEVGLSPSDFVLDGDPAPPKKGRSSPVFDARLLRPNSCMDQDATWYGFRPRPTRHCVRWGPSSPSPTAAQPPQFSANVRCSQTAGWTKMALGVEVGLDPGDFVFDGDPATPEKGTPTGPPHPIFDPCLLWPRSPISATAELLLLLTIC